MSTASFSTANTAADRATQVQLQDQFNGGSVGMLFMLTTLAAVGYVVAAVAFAQTRASSKPAATALALGGAATLLTVSGPLTPLLVASAVLLAIGHGLLLRSPQR